MLRTAKCALVAALLLTVPSALAHADSGASAFITAANSRRAAGGLPALHEAPELDAIAASWAAEEARTGHLAHNPTLRSELGGDVVVVGENVGVGGSPEQIEAAFEASPEHLANILYPDYNEIGAATATDANGRLWVAVEFRDRRRQAPPASSSGVPSPKRSLGGVPVVMPTPPAVPVAVAPHFTG